MAEILNSVTSDIFKIALRMSTLISALALVGVIYGEALEKQK